MVWVGGLMTTGRMLVRAPRSAAAAAGCCSSRTRCPAAAAADAAACLTHPGRAN